MSYKIPAYAKELVKYGLRARREPQKGYPLSGVLIIVEGKRVEYSYIGFTHCLVSAVGMLLPRGVSPQDPAHLLLKKWPDESWVLSVKYIVGGAAMPFIRYEEIPAWVGIRRKSNG